MEVTSANNTNDRNDQNNQKGSPQGRVWFFLYLCVLAVGVVVALYIHSLNNPQSPATQSGRGFAVSAPAVMFPERMDPRELLSGLAGQSGLTPTKENPLGLLPPGGFVRQWAFCNEAAKIRLARYRGEGEILAVKEYFRNAMKERKLELRREADDPFGWHRLDFLDNNSDQSASVALRKDSRDARIVIVQVTVFTLPPHAGAGS